MRLSGYHDSMSETPASVSPPPLLRDGEHAGAALPIWLLGEADLPAWRSAQSEPVARWLSAHQFNGERQRLLVLPDAAGGVGGVVLGLGAGPGL
ncbi:MAG: hypothetical protein EBS39_06880, partial [Gammaproteobacteria bacterium]|nr:hypothetical protein [Gammaproteobacteria bacterium]